MWSSECRDFFNVSALPEEPDGRKPADSYFLQKKPCEKFF